MKTFQIAAGAMLLASPLNGQDISGRWQGTLQVGVQQLRAVVKIDTSTDGAWTGRFYSIDQSPDWGAGMPVTGLTLNGHEVKFAVDAVRGRYQGALSADGTSIEGTWTQRLSAPLVLRRATPSTAWNDPSPHAVQFTTVDQDVKLEVLDWGGSGPALVFLAGLGNTAHVFDKFAPKFTMTHHVYGITRRGFGDSSVPTSGYSADRLGDDVLAALEALKLTRPVLAGHSLAGEEMSSIASRHSDRVAGLIYLDAGYGYAYYDASRGDVRVDVADLRKKLEQLAMGPPDSRPLIKELLEADLPRFERDLQAKQKELDVTPAAMLAAQAAASFSMPTRAIVEGFQKYTKLTAPILAIYAVPHDFGALLGNDRTARAAYEAQDEATTGAQATAFEKGVPSARVVRMPHANHFVFFSNEADVLREMTAFLAGVK